MKTNHVKILPIIAVVCTLAAAILLSCILPYRFANAERKSSRTSTIEYTQSIDLYDDDYNITDTLTASGEITGLELTDISDLTSVVYVHHTPNAFVGPDGAHSELLEVGRLERLDSLTKAAFGTLQFVFFNLDPSDPEFLNKQSDVISRFAYNNSSSVTVDLYLPSCFDAATAYCGDKYVYTSGDMGDYDPTEFIDTYLAPSFVPNYVDCAPQHIDLLFTTSQNTISPDRLEAAQIVTVHYRSKNGADFSSSLPLVGKRETVKSVLSSAVSTHIVLLTIASAALVAFAALALLKKSRHMVPTGVALLGVICFIISELIMFVGKASLGAALSFASSTLLLGAAVCAHWPSSEKIPKKQRTAWGLAVINIAIGFVLSFAAAIDTIRLYAQITALLMTAVAVALPVADLVTSAHIPRAEALILTAICCFASLTKACLLYTSPSPRDS